MKKFSIALFIITIFGFRTSYSQKFEIVFSFAKEDHPRSIIQTPDSGFVISGGSNSFGDNSTNAFLFKIDKQGRWQWVNSYGGNNIDWTDCIQLTSDSGFIMAGYSNSYGLGGYNGYLVRTDSSGNTLWSKVIGGMDWDFLHHVEQTGDGGFIATGGTYNSVYGNEDAWLVRTDLNGDTIWTRSYGGAMDDEARCVRICTNNDYIVFGTTSSFGAGDKDAYLLRINSNGDTLWTKTYGDSLDDEGRYVEQTADGGFILAVSHSQTVDTLKGFKQYQLIKTDSLGGVQWSNAYFGDSADAEPYEVHAVLCDDTTRYACIGYDKGHGGGGKDFMLLKTDSVGGFIFGRTYGGNKDDIGFSMKPDSYKGFIMCGETESYGSNIPNIYILATNCDGDSTGGLVNSIHDISLDPEPLKIFPNPANKICYLTIPGLNKYLNGYSIYSVDGRLMISNSEKLEYNHPVSIDVSALSAGVYFLRTNSEEKIYNAKLIIER